MNASSPTSKAPGAHRGRRPLPARLAGGALMALAKTLTGVRSFWMGCAPEPRQRIYFANHTSHTDFLLLWASLPAPLRETTRPVAGADYWLGSALRRYLIGQVFNGVLVQRNASRPSQSTMGLDGNPGSGHGNQSGTGVSTAGECNVGNKGELNAGVPIMAETGTGSQAAMPGAALQPLHDALAQGDSLIFFPEGTRNMGDELLPFKAGLYHLAKDHPEVELVPVWLDNLHRVMPKGRVIPLPLLCTVTFGTPLTLAPDECKQDFLQRARQALLELNPRQES